MSVTKLYFFKIFLTLIPLMPYINSLSVLPLAFNRNNANSNDLIQLIYLRHDNDGDTSQLLKYDKDKRDEKQDDILDNNKQSLKNKIVILGLPSVDNLEQTSSHRFKRRGRELLGKRSVDAEYTLENEEDFENTENINSAQLHALLSLIRNTAEENFLQNRERRARSGELFG